MAKHDLKKLALLGLASGLIVANPVSADADQQLLSQLNGGGTGLVARLIASASAGDNATSDQDQILRQQRQNSGAGPRTTSGLRNDSGAKGPGGVRETSSRDHMYRAGNGSEQDCGARSDCGAKNYGEARYQRSSQDGRADQSRRNQNNNNNEKNNNNNNNEYSAPRGPLALNDNYNSTTNGTVHNTGKNVNNMDPNAVKTGTMNQSSRGQGVKTTIPSNMRTIDQGGKTNTPSNQPSNELPINTNHTNNNDHLALNDYVAGGSCGGGGCGGDGSYGGSGSYGSYGSDGDNMYQTGRGSGRRGHKHHGCGNGSCGGDSYENNSGRVRSSDQGRQHHHNRMRSQDQMQNPNQTQSNHVGGQKTGFTDQTQPQTRQRPNATSNQGINNQRQNSQRQQPQSNLGQ